MAYRDLEKYRTYQKEWKRRWRLKNPSANSKYMELWRENNRERHREISRKYAKTHRAQVNAYVRKRYSTNIQFRLSCILRGRFKSLRELKRKNAVKYLGCSIEDFKIHTESLFTSSMSWKNYGHLWHFDHIIPLKFYDLSDEEQAREACNYLNIRPFLIEKNQKKGSKMPLTGSVVY